MIPLERAGFLAHARSPIFARRMEEAIACLRAHHCYAVSCSWGKDSTVLLHLAAHTLPRVVAINGRYGTDERLPDSDHVRDTLLSRLPSVIYHEVRVPGEREMYRRVGGFFMDAETPAQRAAIRWWKQHFQASMNEAAQRLGATGIFLGLRAEESYARTMLMVQRGPSYRRRDGLAVALPLAYWTSREVWAYLCAHDLPWLQMYEAAWDRGRARSDFVFATGGAGAIWRHGAWQEWRRAYPQLFASWIEEFPEMQAYL